MLKSYDFFELSDVSEGIRGQGIFEEEIGIIKEISEEFPEEERADVCAVCGCSEIKEFFRVWGRIYYMCEGCNTVFMNPKLESLIELSGDKRLISFRRSERYQTDAARRRGLLWDDLIFWLEYRVFRYLGSSGGISLLDFGSRFDALSERIAALSMCGSYETRETHIKKRSETANIAEADVILYLDHIQKYKNPAAKLEKLAKNLKNGGLLFLSARIGTGFDILAMKGNITNVLPFEHVTLPSVAGLNLILEKSGYEVLEITTPGVMDVKYVADNLNRLPGNQEFIKFMLENSDKTALSEFQRFLQKNQLSSYAQIVARKKAGGL